MYATEELMQEHQVVKQALKILNHLCIRASAQNCLPLEHVNQLLHFFTDFVGRCHHGKEEGALFPAMKQIRGKEVEPILMQSMAEHQTGRNFVRGMQRAYTDYQAGHPHAIPAFVTHAQEYTGLLNQHFTTEDTVLYPVAEQIFTITQHFQLVEAFLMIEDAQIGSDAYEVYRHLVDQLEEIYSEELLNT